MCLTSPQEISHLWFRTRTHKKRNVQMLSHLPRSLNLTFDDMFRDDVSVDSFVMSFGGEQEIVLQPVLIRKIQKLGILNSNQFSGIENVDSSSTNSTVFFTGNAPKNLHVNKCYMAESVDCRYLLKTFASRWHLSLGGEESHHWRVNWLVTLHLKTRRFFLPGIFTMFSFS